MDAFVEPRHDPHLTTEWFRNGVPLEKATRIKTTFDFGFVDCTVHGLRNSDVGIYTCRARNKVGEAVTTCSIKVEDRPTLDTSPQRPEALPRIQELEAPLPGPAQEPETVYPPPLFISHLNNVELWEGETAHFECMVVPKDDPSMKIEWYNCFEHNLLQSINLHLFVLSGLRTIGHYNMLIATKAHLILD